jgi:hypothetical protein
MGYTLCLVLIISDKEKDNLENLNPRGGYEYSKNIA